MKELLVYNTSLTKKGMGRVGLTNVQPNKVGLGHWGWLFELCQELLVGGHG